MANTYKTLGQSAPAATTLTDLYTVPASTSVVASTFVACNRGAAGVKFRASVAPAGAADATSQYIYFDVALAANDTFAATLGITLAATDKVRVQTDTATVTFSLFGVEIT